MSEVEKNEGDVKADVDALKAGEEPKADETKHEEVDPVEAKALEQGWKPKEDFEGEPGDWVSAETFVAKGPLFEKINALQKQIKDIKNVTQEQKKHYAKMQKVEFERALNQLKLQRKAAREDDNDDQIDEINDQIAEVKDQQRQAEAEAHVNTDAAESQAAFVEWKQQNDWYNTNQEARATADALGVSYHEQGLAPDEVLTKVTSQIQKLHPELFRNPNRDKPSGVAGGSSTTGGKKTGKSDNFESSMTSEEKQVMHKFVKSGVMTKDEYIKDLKALKES